MVVESLFGSCFRGKTVLVTGHTGFKGGWLAAWLKLLGAKVVGLALSPTDDRPSFYETADVGRDMVSILGDICDRSLVLNVFKTHEPQIVFHLAAQSLVRQSYKDPVGTYATNVMGTAHVLEAARQTGSVGAVIGVTSDKCYENREWVYGYRENDPMGGYDPYSSSKGAAELVIAAYRNSFFNHLTPETRKVGLASARAGNVIGGGDWADDRIIPDCVRALSAGKPIPVRNPMAVRPWQHVVEPLSGYLALAWKTWDEPERYAGAWNFGPNLGANVRVFEIVERLLKEWGSGRWDDCSEPATNQPHEAVSLTLDCTKAANLLDWTPVYSIGESLAQTVSWYRNFYNEPGFNGHEATVEQIKAYVRKATAAGLDWAAGNSRG